ncbi:MAG: respiratory nitrate reductase subunit gamma [Syntrophaceae bacterium]|nr:respiratory nitrate reductase subunit gamma [Syntrophaceae bacterium]
MFRKTIGIPIIAVFFLLQFGLPGYATVEYVKEFKKEPKKLCVHCHVDHAYPGKSFYEAENLYKWVFMWITGGVSVVIFSYGLISKIWIWRKGRKDSHRRKKKINVFKFLFYDAFLQRGILRLNPLRWVNYMTLSMGFSILFILMLFVYGYVIPAHVRTFGIPSLGGRILDFLMDFLGLSILIGLILSVLRRYLLKQPQLKTETRDNVALLFIFLIVVTGFLLEAFRIAVLPFSLKHSASFVGFTLALLFRDLPLNWTTFHFYFWNFHFLLAFAFIAYVPYSKFVHIVTCPVTATVSRR